MFPNLNAIVLLRDFQGDACGIWLQLGATETRAPYRAVLHSFVNDEQPDIHGSHKKILTHRCDLM